MIGYLAERFPNTQFIVTSHSPLKELEEIEDKLGPIPTSESYEQAKTMALIKDSIEFLKQSHGLKP